MSYHMQQTNYEIVVSLDTGDHVEEGLQPWDLTADELGEDRNLESSPRGVTQCGEACAQRATCRGGRGGWRAS
jgi:hypothetical protein